MTAEPAAMSVYDCWIAAVREGGVSSEGDARTRAAAIRAHYRDLLREHGHVVPGKPAALPCGYEP